MKLTGAGGLGPNFLPTKLPQMYVQKRYFGVTLSYWLVMSDQPPKTLIGEKTMASKPTLQQTLTLANAVPETPENYRLIRELRKALADLVVIAEAAK